MRNDGEWTESRYQSFIKSALRSASVRWPPRYKTLLEAFVGSQINEKTGRMAKHYRCACCKGVFPAKQIEINHKDPVIPVTGFDNWSAVIERMFCEKDGLEALCKDCHKAITKKENTIRKEVNAKRI